MIIDIEPVNTAHIRDYLDMVKQVRLSSVGDTLSTWKYQGIEDFVLKEGINFTKREMDVPQLPKKQCFDNSFAGAMLHNQELFYCEGWAMGVIPIHHAWLCDINGVVYDYTWWGDRLGVDNYVGVPFSHKFINDQSMKHDRCGLFFPDGVRFNDEILHGRAEIVRLND